MAMEELLKNIQIQIEKNNQEVNGRLDRIEKNNKEMNGRLDRIEKDNKEMNGRLDRIEKDNKEMNGRLDRIEKDNKEMNGRLDRIEKDNKEMKSEIKNIQKDNQEIKSAINTTNKEVKDQIHMIKDVNLSHILENQIESKNELKEMIKDIGDKVDKGTKILEDYIQRHEVEHSKINYEIADLQWKTKIAN